MLAAIFGLAVQSESGEARAEFSLLCRRTALCVLATLNLNGDLPNTAMRIKGVWLAGRAPAMTAMDPAQQAAKKDGASTPSTVNKQGTSTQPKLTGIQFAKLLAAQWLILAVILSVVLDLEKRDLRVPFSGLTGDAVYVISNVSAIIDTGWYWNNPRLSAPYTLDLRAFPSNNSVDYFFLFLVTRFTDHPGLALNLTWLLFILLTAATAMYCMVQVGAHRGLALVFSLLYALLPAGLCRATHHFMLSFYLVPFAATLSFLLASGSIDGIGKRFRYALVAGTVLLGLNYPYNASFGAFLIAVGGAIGFLGARNVRLLKLSILTLLLMAAAAVANLSPSLYSWYRFGKPYREYKTAADAEIFGMKIRHLVSPPRPNSMPLQARWIAKEDQANFPLENENASARLGMLPAIGFLLLLGTAFAADTLGEGQSSRLLVGAAKVNLAAILLATVGGFGSLVNLLLVNQIRAYNRMVFFIGYFAVFALSMYTSLLLERWRSNPRAWVAFWLCVTGGAMLSVYDQQSAAIPWRLSEGRFEAEAKVLEDTVRRTEDRLGPGALIFQLPDTPFPPDGIRYGMQPYDNGRAQAFSATLRWSWPNFSLLRQAWASNADLTAPDKLVPYLCLSGFSAVWLDNAGYSGPQSSPEAGLRSICGEPIVTSADGRYLVFDLRHKLNALRNGLGQREFERQRASILSPILTVWGDGFYPEERSGITGKPFHWSKASSVLVVRNMSDRERHLTLRATLQCGSAQKELLVVRTPETEHRFMISVAAEDVSLPMRVPPRAQAVLKFVFHGRPLKVPGDPRTLCFIMMGTQLADMPND